MLLKQLKNHLRITWDDEDLSLNGLLERGKKYINRLIGVDLDFESQDLPQDLLLNYCRYSRNNSTEFFLENFAEEILFLQLQEAVKQNKGDANG